MVSMDELRVEMYRAASRAIGRDLTQVEKSKLVEAYNSLRSPNLAVKAVRAIEVVFDVKLGIRLYIEKVASGYLHKSA